MKYYFRYYGLNGEPFINYRPEKGSFVIRVKFENDLPIEFTFLYENGETTSHGWTLRAVLDNINRSYWREIQNESVLKKFSSIVTANDVAVGVKDSVKAATVATTSIKPLTKKVMAQNATTPVLKPKKASDKFTISSGKLYFNTHTKQVERIVDVQGKIVWTSRHKAEIKGYSKSNFRLAVQAEVDNYLTEAKNYE